MKQRTDLEWFEKEIGYSFSNIELLKNALRHSSYANEKKIGNIKDNERLEFLGDAVLELSSSDYIFKNFELKEGKMTKLRASIVCEPTLALCARQIKLDEFIMLGKGEECTGGRKRDSITSDAFEAVIGAIYLDGGFDAARKFVENFVLNDLEDKQLFYDSKTSLQEVVQARDKEVVYTLLGESGPEHDKTFSASAYAEGMFECVGEGHTKKAAEQKAAYNALVLLRGKGIDIKPKG